MTKAVESSLDLEVEDGCAGGSAGRGGFVVVLSPLHPKSTSSTPVTNTNMNRREDDFEHCGAAIQVHGLDSAPSLVSLCARFDFFALNNYAS